MRLVGLLMTVGCGGASLVSELNDSDRATQSRIVALEKAWNQAYKLADRKALNELLDDQLVLVNDDGSVQDKGEFLAKSQTHRNNRLRRNRLLSTCTEMQRPPLECLERRELRAANPI